MTCGIDEILGKADKSINESLQKLIQDLDTDFDLDLSAETILQSPQARRLRGELDTFAVWLVHGRNK
ncbi:MAG: hypothetical protein HQL76_09510 [Magnetococcales bacterium]|nr:hypothetical protein [Magnetococcales bacterium]